VSKLGITRRDSGLKLLPHQRRFVEVALSPASEHIVILRADAQLGRYAALASLASRVLETRAKPRVLLLSGRGSVRQQWVQVLQKSGARAVPIGRYEFRERLDAANGTEFWPTDAVTIVSHDFAQQSDVSRSLASTLWDLLIIDEAHNFASAHEEPMRRLEQAAERVVLSTPREIAFTWREAEKATVIEWRRDDILRAAGDALSATTSFNVRPVSFALTPVEQQLFDSVRELSHSLMKGDRNQISFARTLLQSLHSSPVQLEATLRGRTAIARYWQAHGVFQEDHNQNLAEPTALSSAEDAEAKGRLLAQRAIEELDAVQVDSKLSAFGELIDRLAESKNEESRTCVIAAFSSTLFYLAAEIERRGRTAMRIDGRMAYADRAETLEAFERGGGMLLATQDAITEEFGILTVTELVFYDLPGSPDATRSLLSRFEPWKADQLTVYGLAEARVTAQNFADLFGGK
jgi:SNF2 family DNA or RNA helicase